MFRDMTFIDDVICGIEGAINYISKENRIENEIFNLGNECPISTISLLNIIEKELMAKTEIKYIESQNEALMTYSDITKAKNLLGYEPKISFKEGIKHFLDWYNNYEKQ